MIIQKYVIRKYWTTKLNIVSRFFYKNYNYRVWTCSNTTWACDIFTKQNYFRRKCPFWRAVSAPWDVPCMCWAHITRRPFCVCILCSLLLALTWFSCSLTICVVCKKSRCCISILAHFNKLIHMSYISFFSVLRWKRASESSSFL